MRNLVPISQAEAAQNGVGAGTNGPPRSRWQSRVICKPPKQGVGVEKEPQNLLPALKLGFGKRLEEFRSDSEFSLHAAGLALTLFSPERLKANQGLIVTGNDDFLAFASLLNEARKMGLGVMDFYRTHIS